MNQSQEPAASIHPAEELEALSRVLQPLGAERRDVLLSLVSEYLEDVSPIDYCCAEGEAGEADRLEWRLAQPSPLDPTRIVFALFYWPEEKAVAVYSFSAMALEGQEGAIATYHREVIYKPRFSSGPLALEALYNDLEFHLTRDQDEPAAGPRTRTNGA